MTVSSLSAGASSEISRRFSWSFPNELGVKHDGGRINISRGGFSYCDGDGGGRASGFSQLSPPEGCRCVLGAGIAASVENLQRVHNPEHSSSSLGLSLHPYTSPIKSIYSAPSCKLFLHMETVQLLYPVRCDNLPNQHKLVRVLTNCGKLCLHCNHLPW